MAKGKAFIFLSYLDSGDEELYRNNLTKAQIMWSRSPLHDKCQDDDGNYKKPHYHWIVLFPGEREEASVLKLLLSVDVVPANNDLKCCDYPQGYYDYLCHHTEDSKNKYQYDTADRLVSPDWPTDLEPYQSAKRKAELAEQKKVKKKQDTASATSRLIQIIKTGEFSEFFQLADFLVDNDDWELLDLFMSKTYFFDRYLTSKRNHYRDERLAKAEQDVEHAKQAERKAIDERNACLDDNVKLRDSLDAIDNAVQTAIVNYGAPFVHKILPGISPD